MIEKLSDRLATVASLVEGKILADVGTDHAYLPISLVYEKKIDFAVASDVNLGPVERAKSNVDENGFRDKIAVVHTNGLYGIDAYHPTDIVIAGMGGDLITQIIEEASWVKDNLYHLILQPMTKAHHLRRYLWENGFTIEKELFSKEQSRVYQIFSCHYRGKKETYDEIDCYIGKEHTQTPSAIRNDFFLQICEVFEKKLMGLSMAQNRSEKDVLWLKSAIELLQKKGNDI